MALVAAFSVIVMVHCLFAALQIGPLSGHKSQTLLLLHLVLMSCCHVCILNSLNLTVSLTDSILPAG